MYKWTSKQSFPVAVYTAYTSDERNAYVSKLSIHSLSDVHLEKHHENSGGDALRGDTRSHPEHDG